MNKMDERVKTIVDDYVAKEFVNMIRRKVKIELEVDEWTLKIIDNIGRIMYQEMFNVPAELVNNIINEVRQHVISELILAFSRVYPNVFIKANKMIEKEIREKVLRKLEEQLSISKIQ